MAQLQEMLHLQATLCTTATLASEATSQVFFPPSDAMLSILHALPFGCVVTPINGSFFLVETPTLTLSFVPRRQLWYNDSDSLCDDVGGFFFWKGSLFPPRLRSNPVNRASPTNRGH